MSFQRVKNALRDTTITGMPKLILAIIADMENDRRGGAFPAINTIAERCGLKKRQVQRIIHDLQASGHLRIETQKGRNGTNRYYTYPEQPVDNSVDNVIQWVSPMTWRDVTHDMGGMSPMTQRDVTHDTQTNKNKQRTDNTTAAPGHSPGRDGRETFNNNSTATALSDAPADAENQPCRHTKNRNVNECPECYGELIRQYPKLATPSNY